MSKDITVLLLEDVATLGRAGDIVKVQDGYARNFLFPEGKAALATESVQQNKKQKERAAKARAEEELASQQEIADKLENTELTVDVRVKEDSDEIFGSITAKTVVEMLVKESGVSVPMKNISGPFPIKKVGTYDLGVTLGQGVEFHMSLVVTAAGGANE